MKKLMTLVVFSAFALAVIGCGKSAPQDADSPEDTQQKIEEISQDPASGALNPEAESATAEGR